MKKSIRVAIIGPGNLEFYYQKLQKISKKKLESELEKIAKALIEADVEIVLVPDKGIDMEIARKYKKQRGRRVIGTIPKSDKRYGINHLKSYMEEKINSKNIFDEFIDSGDWKEQSRLRGFFGDVVLSLGISPGSELEMNYSTYLFKLMKGFKKEVPNLKGVHPQIRANKYVPYTYLIYVPFIKTKRLYPETEAYLKKYGIKLEYIKSPKDLKEKLKKLALF